mgnify:CR=1 FL=1
MTLSASIPEARRAPEIPLALRNGAMFLVHDPPSPVGFLCIVADLVECPICHEMAAFLHLSQSEDRIRLGLPPWQWSCLRCLPSQNTAAYAGEMG